MITQETLYTLALTRIPRLSLRNAKELVLTFGSASLIAEHRHHLTELKPDTSNVLMQTLNKGWDEALFRAEKEIDFAENHNIRCLCSSDPLYPTRLQDCSDAPLVLFYRGTANLNAQHVVSIVGTRHITECGKDLCHALTTDLAHRCPHVIVVSGLAYGIDIHAHRSALKAGIDTVGVLAHGLDRLYPSAHRDTAQQMIQQGGLLTEFMSGTIPDKGNFVRRNRIVAGISDACIVVESAAKGGALITAGIAQDYNREVFACPGRITDPYSEGCNNLIRNNAAQLITCAADITTALGWLSPEDQAALKQKTAQQELFPVLSPDEQSLVTLLQGTDGKQINQLVVEANLPVQRVTALLFEMELRGITKAMNGGRYRLLI
ncbi:MAG: DNA-processing protein DprA [Bacteroidaceae bacterium]